MAGFALSVLNGTNPDRPTMRPFATTLTLCLFSLAASSQTPDYFGQPYAPHVYMSENQGQFADYYGDPLPEEKFKTFGNFPEVSVCEGQYPQLFVQPSGSAQPKAGPYKDEAHW